MAQSRKLQIGTRFLREELDRNIARHGQQCILIQDGEYMNNEDAIEYLDDLIADNVRSISL